MKITRKQLKKIISEAIKVPVFDKVTPEEIEALRAKAREEIDLDSIVGPEKAKKLRGLESDPDMKDTITSMYKTFGSEEPDITSSQEDAFFAGQEQYEKNLRQGNYDEIAELILSGGVEMVRGIKFAKESGVLGDPNNETFFSVRHNLQKSLAGVTDLYIEVTIHDKDFASVINDKMGSGIFGRVHIDKGYHPNSGRYGRTILRGGRAYNPTPVRQNDINAGYKLIRYDLSTKSIRFPLKIVIRGDGTKESNEKIRKISDSLHSV